MPNALSVLAISKQFGRPFPSDCWILYFIRELLELHEGCAGLLRSWGCVANQ